MNSKNNPLSIANRLNLTTMKLTLLKVLAGFLLFSILTISCKRAENSWENAKTAGTQESYLEVVINHPGSVYADSAFSALKKLIGLHSDMEGSIAYFEAIAERVRVA